jgi:hypothetical protein
MMINRFSDKQIQILTFLSKYKFLTYGQLIQLGVSKHKSNLSNLVSSLRDGKKPYVRKIPHRFGVPAKHYLTKKGAEVLIELGKAQEDKIHYPKAVITTDTQDQKHRTCTVDLQIALDLSIDEQGLEVTFTDRYFDTTGSNRVARNLKSKTALIYEGSKTLKADMTFRIAGEKVDELYLLELENGTDAKKAVPKCIMHAKAIMLGSANEKFNYSKAYRTLWVFENESTMVSVRERVVVIPMFQKLKEYFLFKTVESFKEEVSSGWVNLDNKKRKMYY